MPPTGLIMYIQNPVQVLAGSADANVRAGFIPNPVTGPANITQTATSTPDKILVYFFSLVFSEVNNIIIMVRKAISNSIVNTGHNPTFCGTVAIELIG